MNKAIIATVTILFFTLTIPNAFSIESNMYVSRSNLQKTIREKDAEIGRLIKEIEALKKTISTLQAELKQKTTPATNDLINPEATKSGNQKQVNVTKTQRNEFAKGSITVLKHGDHEFQAKVLGKPVFGIRLGEHIDEIRKRFKVRPTESSYTNSDKRDRAWGVDIANKKIKTFMIITYEGIVGAIAVKLTDTSSAAIKRQITTVYESYMIDTSSQIGNINARLAQFSAKLQRDIISSRHDRVFRNYPDGDIFALQIDGEEVSIEITTNFAESDCLLFYMYHNLIDYYSDLREDSTLEGVKEGL